MDMEVDPPKPEQQQVKEGDLFKAAENGDAAIFRALSPENFSKSLSLRNEDGRSLLHVAVSSGHSQVFLLSYYSISQFRLCNFRENVGEIAGANLIDKFPNSFWRFIQ